MKQGLPNNLVAQLLDNAPIRITNDVLAASVLLADRMGGKSVHVSRISMSLLAISHTFTRLAALDSRSYSNTRFSLLRVIPPKLTLTAAEIYSSFDTNTRRELSTVDLLRAEQPNFDVLHDKSELFNLTRGSGDLILSGAVLRRKIRLYTDFVATFNSAGTSSVSNAVSLAVTGFPNIGADYVASVTCYYTPL